MVQSALLLTSPNCELSASRLGAPDPTEFSVGRFFMNYAFMHCTMCCSFSRILLCPIYYSGKITNLEIEAHKNVHKSVFFATERVGMNYITIVKCEVMSRFTSFGCEEKIL